MLLSKFLATWPSFKAVTTYDVKLALRQ